MQCHNLVIQRDKSTGLLFTRPCGQCLSCRINDCRSWFVRSFFELKREDRPYHYFLTLTYSDEFLPEDNICKKEHLKKFLNNLNTSFDLHLRYFATSDYGSKNGRAHYHAIITSMKKITQKQVERIWKKGFVLLKPCNNENVKYTLRYTVKKKPFEKSDKTNFRLISKGWGSNISELYTGQEYFIIEGKPYSLPRYFQEKLSLPKKEVFKTKYYDNLYLNLEVSGHLDDLDSIKNSEKDLEKFSNYYHKIRFKEVL